MFTSFIKKTPKFFKIIYTLDDVWNNFDNVVACIRRHTHAVFQRKVKKMSRLLQQQEKANKTTLILNVS